MDYDCVGLHHITHNTTHYGFHVIWNSLVTVRPDFIMKEKQSILTPIFH
jgi:hypothetical protein